MSSLLDLLGGLNDSERRNRQRQLDYWREREEEQKKHNITDLEEYNKELDKIYATMINDCQNQINDWYLRYASKEGISIAEAKKRVSTADQRYYAERAKEYVANKDFSSRANTEMRLYNLTMKVNRMELLKANLSLAMTSGYNDIEKLTGDFLDKKTLEELKRQAVILGRGADDADKQAHRIVNASFKNASFSDRIWTDMDSLRQRVNMQVQRSLIRGLNPVEIARGFMPELRNDVGKAKYATERLARTEMSRVLTDAAKVSMKQNGYDEYMIICERSACSICRPFDGQHFPIEEMEVAENAPPFHPNCLCHVASYMDREELERMIQEIEDERNPQQTEREPPPPIPPSAMNSFKPARSKADATSYAKEHFAEDVNFGSISLERINAVNEVLTELQEYVPTKKLESIETRRGKANASANYHVLKLNPSRLAATSRDYYDDIQRSRQESIDLIKKHFEGRTMPPKQKKDIATLERQMKFKRFSVADQFDNELDIVRSTVAHEYGHIVADQFFGQINQHRANPNYATNPELRDTVEAWTELFKRAKKDGSIYNLSEYGASNAEEYFAECFAARFHGETLPDYVETFMKELFEIGAL